MHGNAGEGFEIGLGEELGDLAAGRVVEDDADGSVFLRVVREVDHRVVEDPVAQDGAGEEELAGKGDGGLRGHR